MLGWPTKHRGTAAATADDRTAARPARATGEPAYRFLGNVVHGANAALTQEDFRGQGNIPATGGGLVVSNHNSNYDPIALGDFVIRAGRWPRFLGKAELWSVPVVGFFARHCHQIPVQRGTSHAVDSLQAAREAIEAGELVAIYPEGTVGTDPAGWPMTARTGAARLALQTRCPVIPVGQWGAHEILGKKVTVPKFLPRKTLRVVAGEPVDLSDLYDAPDQHAAVRVATERMMRAITDLVAELRDEPAPADRYDLRRRSRVPLGPVTLDEARGDEAPAEQGDHAAPETVPGNPV